VLLGTILHHLETVVNSARVRPILLLGNASLDNLLRFISGKRCFSHYKKCFFPRQRYLRRRIYPSGSGSRSGFGGQGPAEIIFHVGRCEINNGQTRFDFPEVPVGPATHCVRRGKAREWDLLAAAECCEQTSMRASLG